MKLYKKTFPHLLPLLKQRQLPRLAHQHRRPLCEDYGGEEGGVGGVLQRLSLTEGPLLLVGIFQRIDRLRVPAPPNGKQPVREEPIFAHQYKVGEEAGGRLDHAQLAVGEGDESEKRDFTKFCYKISLEKNCIFCFYRSVTSRCVLVFLGARFIMSDSARS